MVAYDDDLQVFLLQSFSAVDYLRVLQDNEQKQILMNVAFCMEAEKLETDDLIFLTEDNYNKMIIVLDGCLELYTEMDNGTHYPIEFLGSGSVINAHQFMVDRKSTVSCRCAKPTTFYTLSAEKFFEIASEHAILSSVRNEVYQAGLEQIENQTHMLDYSIGFESYKLQLIQNYQKKRQDYETMGGDERKDRRQTLSEMKRIIDNREELEKVLEDYIMFKQCVMEKIVKRRQEFVPPNLGEAIDKIKAHNEKEAEKNRLRAKMTIQDVFAKPSAELSDQNNANIQKFTLDMVKT